ncbi:MAG: hypothetical protein LBK94_03820 [Prevotellaceae bacterium]|jgi:hypothetical protein|nr:hypothetical protein [Prevotellaceae bacterium]
MEIEPIITNIGIISGRDAIFLDLVEHKNNVLTFHGEINSDLLNIKDIGNDDFVKYTLNFYDVIFYQCYELDLYNLNLLKSSFDSIKKSKLIEELNSRNTEKITNEHKHYRLATYDYIYEIISSKYILKINIDKK